MSTLTVSVSARRTPRSAFSSGHVQSISMSRRTTNHRRSWCSSTERPSRQLSSSSYLYEQNLQSSRRRFCRSVLRLFGTLPDQPRAEAGTESGTRLPLGYDRHSGQRQEHIRHPDILRRWHARRGLLVRRSEKAGYHRHEGRQEAAGPRERDLIRLGRLVHVDVLRSAWPRWLQDL